jgi:hypothetical protein
MATAVTIFLRSPIFPSRRSSRKARSTLSCLIHELPPEPSPLLMKSRRIDTDMTTVSKRAQPSAARRAPSASASRRLARVGKQRCEESPWGVRPRRSRRCFRGGTDSCSELVHAGRRE